jgi:putative holliday junction resolvase
MTRAPQRLLGVDYGRVRLGVAVCDELGISIRGLGHIPRSDDAAAARVVAALAAREGVTGIVIGLPLHAHGDAGANVRWVRAFTAQLAKACSLPIHEVDERYSSSEAEEQLRAEGKWPAKRGEVDARAAAILLRRWLDGEK